jgi:hypothetical protein
MYERILEKRILETNSLNNYTEDYRKEVNRFIMKRSKERKKFRAIF